MADEQYESDERNASLSDADFLRDLADRLSNGYDSWRLEQLADRVDLVEQYVAADEEGARINEFLAPGSVDYGVADFLGETQGEADERLFPHATLELTEEMSIPPDFPKDDPVAVWNAENQRDLVAELRGEIRNARDNGHDVFAEMGSKAEIAEDIREKTGAYGEVPDDIMVRALYKVARLEATPEGPADV